MIKSLTILIPAYNEENLIGKMLHSILNQSMLEEVSVNVIILVNGSSDNTFNITQKILQSFSKKLFSWKVVNIERRGKTNALNVGLKMSKDEIIICVDSDCYLEKNAIFQIYNNLTKYSKYIIIGGIDIPDFKNISTSTMLYEFQKVQQIYREERSRIIPVGRLMGFKKKYITEFPNDLHSEDTWIALYIAQKWSWSTIKVINSAKVYFTPTTNWVDYIKQETKFEIGFTQLLERFPDLEETYNIRRAGNKYKKIEEINSCVYKRLCEEDISLVRFKQFKEFLLNIFYENSILMKNQVINNGIWEPIKSTKLI